MRPAECRGVLSEVGRGNWEPLSARPPPTAPLRCVSEGCGLGFQPGSRAQPDGGVGKQRPATGGEVADFCLGRNRLRWSLEPAGPGVLAVAPGSSN